ncbi:hypothetical protein HD554DRAFT_2010094 [Boletus coccyginus]|nr:hypothetical protein HD554DRAFT_2010094 [Boletus coccyginus]
MASVEIVRGIAAGSSADRKPRRSRGSVFGVAWFSKDKPSITAKEKNLQVDTDSPLGFTAYRKPPVYVGGASVLVQVWGVGLDGTDGRLTGIHPPRTSSSLAGAPYGTKMPKMGEKDKGRCPPVGYIPGRSFVGRVLEVGWEVGVDVAKRGDWVVGLTSVHRSGALAEFILADRHRVHRVPNPFTHLKYPFTSVPPTELVNEADGDVSRRRDSPPSPVDENHLTINELALLPLCGVPAYRAVRTFHQITLSMGKSQLPYGNSHNELHPILPPRSDKHDFIAGGGQENTTPVQPWDSRPRVLILRAHDGAGALAAQMLVREGWSVWAHVPVPFMLPGAQAELPDELKDEEEDRELDNQRDMLRRIEDRLREWGVDESRSVVSLMSYLTRSRVRLDAILDTIGGRETWDAGRLLLSRPVHDPSRQETDAQFTTLVGDTPDRVVSTAGENFRAGVRALRLGGAKDQHPFEDSGYHEAVTNGHGKDKKAKAKPRPVNYSWVNVVSDIDWEGSDVHDTLCTVLRMAASEGVKPVIGPADFASARRRDKGKKRAASATDGIEEGLWGKVVPFESTPNVFLPWGGLEHGGTVVSRVAV